ncbi:MAG: TauD/TfdA family dioxygenase [Deltaproteobacteria bacterium]|nr:TauD/TfdA family dioxygenase [Deltaproteobacteria bacterium]
MTITIAAITPGFAAEVGDVDLTQPLSSSEVEEIKRAFWQYGVLVFPEQRLTEQQQLAFARHIGPLESNIVTLNKEAKLRITSDLIDISNLTVNERIRGEQSRMRQFQLGNRLWQATLLEVRSPPAKGGVVTFCRGDVCGSR